MRELDMIFNNALGETTRAVFTTPVGGISNGHFALNMLSGNQVTISGKMVKMTMLKHNRQKNGRTDFAT